ncbi:MAG: hypothetical protein E6K70_15095 [Planctomycetota bacterium]|nr:MAG: hypothetical protein E6K70_15095 [Planctomycetota bacterium]
MARCVRPNADQDDFRGHQRLADEDRSDAGDGQRQVRAQTAFEQAFHRVVEDAGTAEDGSEKGDPVAANLLRPPEPCGQIDARAGQPAGQPRPQVDQHDEADQPGHEIERHVALAFQGWIDVRDLAMHACASVRLKLDQGRTTGLAAQAAARHKQDRLRGFACVLQARAIVSGSQGLTDPPSQAGVAWVHSSTQA